MVVHSCEKTDFSAGTRDGGDLGGEGSEDWSDLRLCAAPGGVLVNDRNNRAQPGATLKIDWRPEVKRRGRGRVEMACEVVWMGRMGLHGLAAAASCA